MSHQPMSAIWAALANLNHKGHEGTQRKRKSGDKTRFLLHHHHDLPKRLIGFQALVGFADFRYRENAIDDWA